MALSISDNMAVKKAMVDGDPHVVCRRLSDYDERPEVTVMVRALCVDCGEKVAVPPDAGDGTPCICSDCHQSTVDDDNKENGNDGNDR